MILPTNRSRLIRSAACLLVLIALIIPSVAGPTPMTRSDEHIIVLHGLCRTPRAMVKMTSALEDAGYSVTNDGYPSRTATVHELAETHLHAQIESARAAGAKRIHFVTHSMGGILVRDYLANHNLPDLGRIVMIAPPNQGSEVVDKLGTWKLFGRLNGPAGSQLGTNPESVPNSLGSPPPAVEFGVIAGTRSINWIQSLFMIRGRDDGKVSVENTKLKGMRDHLVVGATHPYISGKSDVTDATIRFLQIGKFSE